MKLLFAAVASLGLAACSFGAGAIKWASSYDAALSLAKRDHKLVMIDFYTDWCGWCKKLDSDTYPSPEVVKASLNFVPVKVNAEKEGKAAAARYKVDGYPTIVFVDGQGNQDWKIVGYMPPADFAKQMQLAANVKTDVTRYERVLADHPADVSAAAKLIPYYAGSGDLKKVEHVMAKVEAASSKVDPHERGDAFNAAGDAFQTAGQFPQAVAYFTKAIAQGVPKVTAYARISIASCYLQSNQPAKAKPYFEALLKMGPEADAYRSDAKKMLDAINKGGN